ncbi:MAG: MBOAT family O-acyltransferase [Opitutales bacterium]
MTFNSIDFFIFLPIVFGLYWFAARNSIKLQNFILLLASYVFYAFWDWRFLFLILFSSLVDYFIGLGLSRTEKIQKRKYLLVGSIIINLGFLGFFKYYNFFAESFSDAFSLMGHPIRVSSLSIILPVGISFYTFQTLSYSIDLYRKKISHEKNVINFLNFVSFFPQLVAGPIERASNLLPQFNKKRYFSYGNAVDGSRQILWGLFKKIVIADGCAESVNLIFNNYEQYSGSTLLLGAILFSFQIYCDFSGYSDIAIGTARLFGIDLMQNFASPYFSRNMAEFWRRWHISLSTWFRDYLYIPSGGSKVKTFKNILNVFVIFIVSGLWHGANWTFMAWGFLHALYFLPLVVFKDNRRYLNTVAMGRYLPSFSEIVSMISTYLLVVFAWIFFRAESMSQAVDYINIIFSESLVSYPEVDPRSLIVIIACFLAIEWFGREKQHPLADMNSIKATSLRWGLYFSIISIILLFRTSTQQFIYFQF